MVEFPDTGATFGKEDKLAVVFHDPPGGGQLQNGGQRVLRPEQSHVEAMALQQLFPVMIGFQEPAVLAGEFFTIEVAAAVEEDLLSGSQFINQVIGQLIFGKDTAAGDERAVFGDQFHGEADI